MKSIYAELFPSLADENGDFDDEWIESYLRKNDVDVEAYKMALIQGRTIETVEKMFRGDNRALAFKMIGLINDFSEYWPMTLRGFYYQAVSAGYVTNTIPSYNRIKKMLATLRREELLPWKCMEDKTRHTSTKRGVSDLGKHIESQLESFLDPRYYQRCLIQEQDVYVELSVEKDALSTIVKDAAWMYCTKVTVTKGQISATFLEQMSQRFAKAVELGKEPILLHLGDLDPTGIQIPKSMKAGFMKWHDVDVDVRNVALTPDQCSEHELPTSIDPVKESDSNTPRWHEQYGNMKPTELDALHPDKLTTLVERSLIDVYDTDEMQDQREAEQFEREKLKGMRKEVLAFMCEKFPTDMKRAGYTT